jgi:hypothetical protein
MAFRFATTSGLALAAALFATGATRAQSFFDSYQLSPRQVAGVLSDDGYQLRGPIMRRGDVYVCDAVSVSGRSVRLIVSARDGRVIDRYVTDDHRRYADDSRDWGWSRSPRTVEDEDNRPAQPRDQFALGDLFNPPSRVYGNDMFAPRPTPAPSPTSDSVESPKPKHHALKKHHESGPAVAKAPASEPTPAAQPSATPSPSVAAVAPSAPEKSSVEPPKPAPTPDVVKPAPTPEAVAPAPSPQPKQAAVENDKPAAVEAEKPVAPVTQKPESQRKKINDLPVGTLD